MKTTTNIIDGTRLCCICKLWKSLDQFVKRSNSIYYRSECQSCRLDYIQTWSNTTYNTMAKIVTRNRTTTLKSKGITIEQYNKLFRLQNGCCAICGTNKPGGHSKRYFAVDHDHSCCPGKKSCGKCIRGLLCFSCNLGIGFLQEDRYGESLFLKAGEYIKQHQLTGQSNNG